MIYFTIIEVGISMFRGVVLISAFMISGCLAPATNSARTPSATPSTPVPSVSPTPSPTPTPTPSVSPTPTPSATVSAAHVFFSGHSLINLNTPTVFAQFAQSQSLSVNYQLQMGLGSSIKVRLQCPWNGQQKDGHSIQYRVQDELRRSNVYDTLVLAENHNIVENILYNSSTSMTRIMYDFFTTGNFNGQAYLYENWMYIDNPGIDEFLARIDRERAAWNCVASYVNTTRGFRRPIKLMPGSTAIAALIREIRAGTVPGISVPGAIFTDNVHLNAIGNYYISLLYYGVIYQRSPVGLPHTGLTVLQDSPPVLSNATAARLQQIAWEQAQIAINDTTSHFRTHAQCQTDMDALCTQTYGNTWACNAANTGRLSAAVTQLNNPVDPENGAWCLTGPAP